MAKGGEKKYKRNENKCKAYQNAMKHEMSHLRRLVRHLIASGKWNAEKRQPQQTAPQDALAAWSKWMARVPNNKVKTVLDQLHA